MLWALVCSINPQNHKPGTHCVVSKIVLDVNVTLYKLTADSSHVLHEEKHRLPWGKHYKCPDAEGININSLIQHSFILFNH